MTRYAVSLENGRTMPTEIRRILVPVDFSETSLAAVDYALDLAGKRGAVVHVLHVWQVPPYPGLAQWTGPGVDPSGAQGTPFFAQRVHDLAADRLTELVTEAQRPGLVVEGILDDGDPVAAIAGRATEYDLLVLGAHDEGAKQLFTGNVADRVAGETDVAVATVRLEPARASNF